MSALDVISSLPFVRDVKGFGGAPMPAEREENVEAAALEARASSDEGLRRLRITARPS